MQIMFDTLDFFYFLRQSINERQAGTVPNCTCSSVPHTWVNGLYSGKDDAHF